ncbi:MAG TPA: divergent polysaccharide deacetylase family protein, partial [Gammaproteobacteria bacterium]|nr:divergent polysaccharide deacetylase family protein [Gammaproteobacteria bacterium]
PYAAGLARQAHEAGKEVLLHLPLEAVHHEKLGPGGLTLPMTRREFVSTLRADLAAIPAPDGVNNHMGSLITQHPGDMGWLMDVLSQSPSLFYVDSRTTARTVAYEIAREHGVPATWRDVFLDDVQKPEAVTRQLQRLIAIAKRRGTAIAIGHPYPVTLRVLKEQLPRLEAAGVRLVPVREIIARQSKHAPPAKIAAGLASHPAQQQDNAANAGGARADP